MQQVVPSIITFLDAHGGVLFIAFDEPSLSSTQPFLVVGPRVKANDASTVNMNHSSHLKSVEAILKVPVLPTVTGATDFADFFEPGWFP